MGRDHTVETVSAWKKQQTRSKWKNIIAILIWVTLMFAIVNGLAKGFSIKSDISGSKWDSKSSIPIAINTRDPTLFIYQPQLKNLAVFTISGDTLYETGDYSNPLKALSTVVENSGEDLVKTINNDSAEKMFFNFASILTPVKLITTGWGENFEKTNITRIDAFKLWWQVKGLSVNNIVYADLSKYQEEIITGDNNKVLGADTASLNKIASKYFENLKVLEENISVKIGNASGQNSAATLAASFIASEGGSVVSVEKTENTRAQTLIVTDDVNSYTAKHLVKIFDCDINEAKTSDNNGEITLIIGTDFTSRYYE
jgi:hypothetical protein